MHSDSPAEPEGYSLDYPDQGITVFDQDLRLVAWNDRFLEIYDYPRALAFEGAEFASFVAHSVAEGEFGPGEPERLVAERVRKARAFARHQFERRRPDGRVIRVVDTPLPSGGFVTTHTDLTALEQRQIALERLVEQRSRELTLSEERLRLIADEVPAGIAHLDTELNFLYVNKRFAQAYNRTPEAVVGLNAADVLHPRTLSESRRFFEQARRGAMVDFEMELELPDGRHRFIRTLLRPEHPSIGDITRFYLVSIDVTRRKATLSALMRSQKMDALGRMASGISHDFNNLLTVILGNLTPLADQLGDTALVEEYLIPAISAARRGSSLTRRLLTLARREQYDPVPTDIGAAIDDICTLLKSSMPATLKLGHRQLGPLPPASVDRAQLEMALLNLSLNARDATGGIGRIDIETRPYDLPAEEAELLRLPAGRYLRIRFSDDGCGMSAEQTERAFEPFFTSQTAGAGSGLGLSMVYGFVQQSNGAVWVDSAPGSGTTFSILLPGTGLQAPVATRPPDPEAEAEDAALDLHRPDGIVLLVEDDRDVRRTIRRKVASLGYPLVEAASGEEALDLLGRIEDIALVLSDIDMPGGIDGNRLAQRIAKDFPATAVVLMSGHPQHRDGAGGIGVPFLQKPFGAEELEQAFAAARNGEQDGRNADQGADLPARG